MLRRQWLLIVNVERRDDLAGLDGGEESGFVDERPARRVDENGALLHASDVVDATSSLYRWLVEGLAPHPAP